MKTIPNFIRNTDQILNLVERHLHLFKPREGKDIHASIIPNVFSQFTSLKDGDMTEELKDAIFADADFDELLKDTYGFIQIQKYEQGDYIAPHTDAYAITKLHLITLTSSDIDGLVCETKDHKLIKIYDQAGTYIDFPYDAFHWVDPVKTRRFSLVIGE
jgi:hypothetical protein